jgi:TonB family protein
MELVARLMISPFRLPLVVLALLGGTTTAAAQPAAPDAPADEGTPAKPRVVAPELQHYEPPVYPPEAWNQKLEAQVRLLLTVDDTGAVTAAEVIEPVGNGFDEAAQAAAAKLRFSPATVDGVPRTVRIGFEYNFTVEEAEPAPTAEPEAPRFGELGGELRVSGSDVPLPGIEVVAEDALGGAYRTQTDAQGRWTLANLPPGLYKVRVAADGFMPLELDETVVAGEATDLVYRLSPKTDELEIVVAGERPPREVTRRVLQRREIERVPGTAGDALRSIQSLPGVARPPGLAGLLIVRGSAPQDTQTFVNGANVPLIYHFGGLSSVVPTELLDRIDFYPGNFSVRYGRVMGGIVDVSLRSPNTECYGPYGVPLTQPNGAPVTGCYHGLAQVDLIDGRLLLQGPIGKSKEWSFAVAGRRSWIDSWLGPALEAGGASVTNAPVYYDYQVIVDRNVGPGDKLSIRFYGSDDSFQAVFKDPAAQEPGFGGNLRFGTSFYNGQILYQKDLTRDVSLDTMVAVGKTRLDFALGGNLAFNLTQYPILTRSEMGFKISETARWNIGLDFLMAPYEVVVRAPPPPRPGEPSSGPFITQQPLETADQGFAFRPAWYTDVEWQPTRRLRIVPGARVDYARDSGHADFSPRLNARYALVLPEDGFWGGRALGTTLKGGVGMFAQPPEFQETDPVFGTPFIQSNRAMHYAVGFEQGLTEQVLLSMEGFYKDLDNLVSRAPNASGAFVYGNAGSGQVVGLETLLKYNPDERFFGWMAYTLSRSTRRNSPLEEERLFQYDQTHNFIILGSYRLGRGWEIGARFRIVSGPLQTPLVRSPALPALYAADGGTYVPLEGVPFSERMPLFHNLDVRIDKRWQFETWRLSTYLDVQNVYNNPAYEGFVYNYNYSQRGFQTGLPIIPALGVRGEF